MSRPPVNRRFRFGANWRSFARTIDESRVHEARLSLSSRLGEIGGLRFLDAGCGSGLFSLAALQLGAMHVRSFDLDPESVEVALSLKHRFASEAENWTVERGDVLNRAYLETLGEWDVVYCWGVLHHTGDLWNGAENVARLVAPGGHLFVSIYNDQGIKSVRWARVKRAYQRLPHLFRPVYVVLVMAPAELRIARDEGARAYIGAWRSYKTQRGMSRWHDLVDWVGGYPYEVAKPTDVEQFFQDLGLTLKWSRTEGVTSGNNEFVFRRMPDG